MLDSDLDRESEGLSEEETAATRKKSLLNALVLGIVFVLVTLAPHPWKLFAPLLFVIPLIYSLVEKHKTSSGADSRQGGHHSMQAGAPRQDPYTVTPRDPKDPRRYKPIG